MKKVIHSAVAAFEGARTPRNAHILIELAKSDLNLVPGLTKRTHEEAKKLVVTEKEIQNCCKQFKEHPTPTLGRKIIKLIDDSSAMSIDYGLTRDEYNEIKNKAAEKMQPKQEVVTQAQATQPIQTGTFVSAP